MIQISNDLAEMIMSIVSEFSTVIEASIDDYKKIVEKKKEALLEKLDSDAKENDMPDFIYNMYKNAALESAQAAIDETIAKHNSALDAIRKIKGDITVALDAKESTESDPSLNPILEAFTDGFKSVLPEATLDDVLDAWYDADHEATEHDAFVNGCKKAAGRLK